MIYLIFGVWSLAVFLVSIQAIRLSYRIEARSPKLVNRTGIPRWAMMFHTATNLNVPLDEETQALRRRMNIHLLIVLAGFIVLALAIWLVRAVDVQN